MLPTWLAIAIMQQPGVSRCSCPEKWSRQVPAVHKRCRICCCMMSLNLFTFAKVRISLRNTKTKRIFFTLCFRTEAHSASVKGMADKANGQTKHTGKTGFPSLSGWRHQGSVKTPAVMLPDATRDVCHFHVWHLQTPHVMFFLIKSFAGSLFFSYLCTRIQQIANRQLVNSIYATDFRTRH